MSAVVVVGGGPAGLMAADVASAAGLSVTLCEQMPSLGRKLLMAGRGGLNLTKSEPLERFLQHYGPARDFLEGAIRRFPPEALVAFAEGLGQETFVGSSGRIFPRTMKASPLLRAWLGRLARQGVEVRTRRRWLGVAPDGCPFFEGPDGARETLEAGALVLALGGASWPRLGATGDWVAILEGLGVPVRPLAPANAGLVIGWSPHFRQRFEGEALKRIRVRVGGLEARGEAVVTAAGLEGGVIYALGPELRRALAEGSARIEIDLRPDLDVARIAERLSRPRGKQSTSSWLRRALQLAPVAIGLLREAEGRELPLDPVELAARIKRLPLTVTSLGGIERAISSAGGVALEAVDSDMMLNACPGVFVAGEMLDWEAPTGGYLLQAVLATGYCAGAGAVRYLARRTDDLSAL